MVGIGLLGAGIWILLYTQARTKGWMGFLTLLFLIHIAFPIFSPLVAGGLWIGGLIGIGVLSIKPIRQKIVTLPLLSFFRKTLPPMSATEREAIEAGDVWWEGALFRGKPDWDQLLALPKPTLTHEERSFLEQEVEHLKDLLQEWKTNHETLDLPSAVWSYLKEAKFFGMIIPKSYGGLGFSALAHSTIVQKIASQSLTAAITTMVPNSLGPAELLIHYGTKAQKEYYLPRLAAGSEIPCFALTSAVAGSDAGAIEDYGHVVKGEFEGKEVLGIELTWRKRYITLAPVATVLGLAFKLYDPNHLLGSKESLGITLCLIPTSHPGVQMGNRHYPLHQPFMNGPTEGNQVFVPLDWVIGGEAMIGKGWRMLVECLSAGRGISLPALSTASAKTCYRAAGAYAAIRQQFNHSIGKFEGVEEALAQIAGNTYRLEATRLLTLTALDQALRPAIVTAMAKYHMTELGRKIVNHAMDIHGGRAIMLGPHNYLAGCYESIPISITVEGANILTRNLIIFGQGAIRCHPYIQAEMEAMSHPDPKVGLPLFDKVLFEHIRYSLSNMVKACTHALTGGKGCQAPKVSHLRSYYRQVTRMSLAFSFVADLSLILLGGSLKRRERLSARLGDVLSALYQASALLKYFYDFSSENKEEDVAHTRWGLQMCLWEAQTAFMEFFDNFPIPGVGFLLKKMIFPWGKAYSRPTDQDDRTLARTLMRPSAFRDRVTQHAFSSISKEGPLAQLDKTLDLFMDTREAFKKLKAAFPNKGTSTPTSFAHKMEEALRTNQLTPAEAEKIKLYLKAEQEAIAVDEFTPEQLVRKEQ